MCRLGLDDIRPHMFKPRAIGFTGRGVESSVVWELVLRFNEQVDIDDVRRNLAVAPICVCHIPRSEYMDRLQLARMTERRLLRRTGVMLRWRMYDCECP